MVSKPSPRECLRRKRFHKDGDSDDDQLAETLSTALTPADQRSRFQTDRDRILYSDEFRRLAGVTQVTSAVEGRVFHNRLTHSLKVAQVARRLAERCLALVPGEVLQEWGGLDPDVVEAAALAHDLGHPPFGHVAEKELNRLCHEKGGLLDGFEGNAQSFRIVTRLSAHRPKHVGLDLTRATLNAILKYPYPRDLNDNQRSTKWGVYNGDQEAFAFAQEAAQTKGRRTLEAEIMDFADDLAFSVHDFDDFYRAGLIPIIQLLHPPPGWDNGGNPFPETDSAQSSETKSEEKSLPPISFEQVIQEWIAYRRPREPDMASKVTEEVRKEIRRDLVETIEATDLIGNRQVRARMQQRLSKWIDGFLKDVTINPPGSEYALAVPENTRLRMKFLHFLVYRHVINHPRLATLQHGQRKIVRELWCLYFEDLKTPKGARSHPSLVPPIFQEAADEIQSQGQAVDGLKHRAARLAADIVSSFSDQEAVAMHQRLHGATSGSVLDVLN